MARLSAAADTPFYESRYRAAICGFFILSSRYRAAIRGFCGAAIALRYAAQVHRHARRAMRYEFQLLDDGLVVVCGRFIAEELDRGRGDVREPFGLDGFVDFPGEGIRRIIEPAGDAVERMACERHGVAV